jgi:4-amino-4-deoxy-L-arabinose transferase-like glycosyltransferase
MHRSASDSLHGQSRPSKPYNTVLVLVLLFGIALLPRVIAIGEFSTVDEAVHWFNRARAFLAALATGDYAQTYQVGHPGVTTMWLGALGSWLADYFSVYDSTATKQLMRMPGAIVHASVIATAFLPLRRLFNPTIALIATLLWATDPFLIAHGQLLHLDALLTSFMVISLLYGLIAFGWDTPDQPTLRWGALVGSGIAGGLALLTKSPAVLLPVEIAAVAIVALTYRGKHQWRSTISALLVWGITAVGVWFVLWPAAWLDPIGVMTKIVQEALSNGGDPQASGNFLLGQQIADPGLAFYPLALAFRSTPQAAIGLIAAVIWLWLPQTARRERRTVLLLAACVLVMVAILSSMAKKFDRYALPTVPLLQIIAACGLAWLLKGIATLVRRNVHSSASRTRRSWLGRAAWGIGTLFLGIQVLCYHPYELAYYNPLLGGGATAQKIVPVGWGEGYDLAMEYIRAQPGGCSLPTVVWYRVLIEGLSCGSSSIRMGDVSEEIGASYVILYIDQWQRGYYPEATNLIRSRGMLIHTVQIRGIDYAQIYRMPQPSEQAIDAEFNRNLQLRSYQIDTTDPAQVALTLTWQNQEWLSGDEYVFLHVLNGSGQRVAQVDVPLRSTEHVSELWRPSYLNVQQQAIPLPDQLPTGVYWVSLGVYHAGENQRIPLTRASAAFKRPASGADSLTIGPFEHTRNPAG